MKKYDDIINLPHPVSKKHPQMGRHNRAAQFSPFAALTGYKEAIECVDRRVSEPPDTVLCNETIKKAGL